MATETVNAVEMLEALDLGEIQKQIAACQKRLNALRVLEKAAKINRDGKPARHSPSKTKSTVDEDDIRRRAHDFLSTEGPTGLRIIATQINVPWQRLMGLLKHEWFVKVSDNLWDVAK